MQTVQLGQTGLQISRLGFGGIPIQRIDQPGTRALLKAAHEAGINYIDTARAYTVSEEWIGQALQQSGLRDEFIIATKCRAITAEEMAEELNASLRSLRTDHIELYQFHNPSPEDFDRIIAPGGALEALKSAHAVGIVEHIGVTAHRQDTALAEIGSGAFETLQFPLSALSSEKDLDLVRLCKEKNMGVIGMKGLAGGLLTSAAPTMAYLRRFDNLVPIWGFQRECEIREVLELEKDPPILDEAMMARIEKDRKELAGDFCRGCGYCLPCPQGIPINNAARMPQLLRRSPYAPYLTDEWAAQMERITTCINCRACASRCPYELDTPKLLRAALEDYRAFRAEHLGK